MTDNKYKNGKIYKITCDENDLIYVGSTCEKYLSNRHANHKSSCKKYYNGKSNYITSIELVKYSSSKITLLESCVCNSVNELRMREDFWIKKLKNEGFNIVNKVGAISNPNRNHDYYMKNKEEMDRKQKEYNKKNIDKVCERQKNYRKNNKDKLRQMKKEYAEQNKDKIKVKCQKYYIDNLETIKIKRKETVLCDVCLISVKKDKFNRHCKSDYHNKFVQLNKQIDDTTKEYNDLMNN